MEKVRAPLAEAIDAYIAKGRKRGHMPGHKGENVGYLARFGELAAWDLTEADGLDDLHEPVGAIAEAERLMAEAVGAEEAFFLVNGATVGIQAAILSACKPGDTLLLPRNAHRAVWSAIALGGVRPVWLEVREKDGLALGITPGELEEALLNHPEAKAVFLLNPAFYGVLPDMVGLLKVARQHGVLTIVDEAHGAHFAFVRPEVSAVRLGADLVIDSWHKSMGSLGQTAVLLNNSRQVFPKRWLNLLQTTSPSYPLMSSLDLARAAWQQYGELWGERLGRARKFVAATLAECSVLSLFGAEDLPPEFGYDDTKILLYSRLGHSGWQVAKALREQGIEPEFADSRYVLLLLTYADGDRPFGRAAFLAADNSLVRRQPQCGVEALPLGLPDCALLPHEAVAESFEQVKLSSAVGRIAAELLVPYPPGIAVCGPGEVISREIVEFLCDFGGEIQGLSSSGTVAVLAEQPEKK